MYPQCTLNSQGGYSDFNSGFNRGVTLELQNPYPTLRVSLAGKVQIFRDFSQKGGKIVSIFGCQQIFEILEKCQKMDPCLGIFFARNGTHV